MKLWIAHWLRKLASRLDGMPYDALLSRATSDAVKLQLDLLWTGNAYIHDGKRVPPEDVVRDTRTGRMHIHRPNLKQEPRPDGPFAPGPVFGQPVPVDCECDYWPGITGSNGRITQHAVNCPQRPDTLPRPDADLEYPGMTENGR